MLCFSVCAVIDYLFFAKNMGIISSDLRYENHEIVFFDTKAQVAEIAEKKMPDLNAANIESATSMIMGTARSMGIVVEE